MNLLVAVFSLLLHSRSGDTLLVVDKDLRRPVERTHEFTAGLYLQRNFPVYESEAAAVSDVAERAAKWIEKEQPCTSDTSLAAGHTSLHIEVRCEQGKRINLTLVTEVEGSQTSFSFAMARNEYDMRKVQRKLLDFASYISR